MLGTHSASQLNSLLLYTQKKVYLCTITISGCVQTTQRLYPFSSGKRSWQWHVNCCVVPKMRCSLLENKSIHVPKICPGIGTTKILNFGHFWVSYRRPSGNHLVHTLKTERSQNHWKKLNSVSKCLWYISSPAHDMFHSTSYIDDILTFKLKFYFKF